MCRGKLLAWAFVVLFAETRACAQETPLYKDLEAIEKLVPSLLEAIEQCDVPASLPPKIVMAEPRELAEALRRDIEPQLRATGQAKTEDELKVLLQSTLNFYGLLTMCKYGFATKTIYVSPQGLERMAGLLKNQKVLEDEFFRALLLHELVHACDDASHSLDKKLAQVDNVEQLHVWNALIEGHAQWVTRKVLLAEGKQEWFEELERTMTQGQSGAGEVADYQARIATANVVFAYRDGLRFFEKAAELFPEKGFRDFLQEPPQARSEVVWPEKYRQAPRPVRYISKEVFQQFLAPRKREGWDAESVDVSVIEIRAGFSLLPAAEVDPVLQEVRRLETWSLRSLENRASTVTLAVFEFEDDSNSEACYHLEEKLLRKKDETMRTGLVRIKRSKYAEPSLLGADRALECWKEIMEGFQPVRVYISVAQKGPVVVELNAVNPSLKTKELRGWAEEFLALLE